MLMKSKKRGFTLIELLVVIAIIAILAAILFPVFGRAREQARKIACLSNLKQLSTALSMYLQDWDEYFPMNWRLGDGMVYTFYHALLPYIKNAQVFLCPSDSAPVSMSDFSALGVQFAPLDPSSPTGGAASYHANWLVITIGPDNVLLGDSMPVVNLAQIPLPAETAVFYEATVGGSFPFVSYVQARHNDLANVSFVDGHVRSVKADWYGDYFVDIKGNQQKLYIIQGTRYNGLCLFCGIPQ